MTHVFAVLHGVAAAVVASAIFHAIGAVLLPRRLAQELPGRPVPLMALLPALSGAAVYTLAAWIAITARAVPLLHVLPALVSFTAVLALLRRRAVIELSHPLLSRSALIGLGVFAALFALAYACGGDRAPGLDVIAQATHAKRLLEVGSSRATDGAFQYRSHPAVVFILGALSLFYGRDPLAAALPLQSAVGAAFGLCIFSIARTVLRLRAAASMLVAALAVTSVFHNSVDPGFLTAMCGAIPVLFLTGITAARSPDRRFDPVLTATFAASYALLWFIDPIVLVMAAIAHATVIVLRIALEPERREGAMRFGLTALVPIVLLGAAFHQTVRPIVAILGGLVRQGGGPAPVLSPIMALLLPFAFVPFAAIAWLIGSPEVLRRFSSLDAKLLQALAAYAALGIIVGNVAVHAIRPAPDRQSTRVWDGLKMLGDRRFAAVTLQLRNPTDRDRALAGYYFPAARLALIDARREAIPFESISERSPLVIEQLDCRDVGHGDVISVPGFGCVLLNPPSAKLDVTYSLSRPLLFMKQAGMTERERGGRWNIGEDMEWHITADVARDALDRAIYLNVSLNPFLPGGVMPPRIRFRFINGDIAEVGVDRQTRLSVPLGAADWYGGRFWILPLRVHFPDGRTMLFHEISFTVNPTGNLLKRAPAEARPPSR